VSEAEAPDRPTGGRCPICGRAALERYRPFCSKRCADVDLNRWLSGAYVVPAAPAEDEDDAPPRPPASEED